MDENREQSFAQFLTTVQEDLGGGPDNAAADSPKTVTPRVRVQEPESEARQQLRKRLQAQRAEVLRSSEESAARATENAIRASEAGARLDSSYPTMSARSQMVLPTEEPATDPGLVGDKLTLADVIASSYRSYPQILQARQELPIASGGLLAAYGAYDTKFQAHSLSEPTGYYENYRSGLGLARQTWWGGYLSAGYRIGRGFYQPWYKERQTDDAGEFKVAFAQPLLQGRAIDPQRVAIFQASIQQQAAAPLVQQTILNVSGEAVQLYWNWIAAGGVVAAQRNLLEIAERRAKGIELGVKAQKFKPIDAVQNQSQVAERRGLLFKAEQKYQTTALKLGLFLRDASGSPTVPVDAWLPDGFPKIINPQIDLNAELAAALSRRPEPALLQLEYRHVQWDRQLARNDMLPRFNFVTEASQDMGEPATKSDDKGEFELVIGFQSEVPIQRRKARGKFQQTAAKMIGINEKLRLVRDKIAQEIAAANVSLMLAEEIVQQNANALEAALETQEEFEKGFINGKTDLIDLIIYEAKSNELLIKLIESQRDWFTSLGRLQLAMGLDPLDQAMLIDTMPPTDLPGPKDLPAVKFGVGAAAE